MTDRLNRFRGAIDSHIHVWTRSPSLIALAQALESHREIIVSHLTSQNELEPVDEDKLRRLILHHALEHVGAKINPDHFILFREPETVRVVLEDSFGIVPGIESDEILIPYQAQALTIIVRCLMRSVSGAIADKDLLCFLSLFSGVKNDAGIDQDRTMRLRSMVWFIYMSIETAQVDREVCRGGLDYFSRKFRELLQRVLEGEIIDEDSRRPGFEGGKWEPTLWGWLQGEDRREFVMKLQRQFNLENRTGHANRYLLAEHRRCVFDQVLALFC